MIWAGVVTDAVRTRFTVRLAFLRRLD